MIIRYIIEHLPKHEDPHHHSQRSVAHNHCKSHVWLRLDDDTILVMAHFANASKMRDVVSHPDVVVLPHLHDKVPVYQILSRKEKGARKIDSLKNRLGLLEHHTTADLLGKILSEDHYQFEPQI